MSELQGSGRDRRSNRVRVDVRRISSKLIVESAEVHTGKPDLVSDRQCASASSEQLGTHQSWSDTTV